MDQYHLSPGMPTTVHPSAQKTIDKLRGEIAQLKAKKKTVMAQKKELQDEKKKLLTKTTELKKTNEQLQTKTTELKKTNEQLEAQNTELKKTVEQLEEHVGNLGREVSHAWKDTTRLSNLLDDTKFELANTQGQLEFERSLRD